MTAGCYRTIIADPPWPIGDFPAWFKEERRSQRERDLGHNPRPYDVMSLDEIKALLWVITAAAPMVTTGLNRSSGRRARPHAAARRPEGDEVYVFLPSRFEGTEDEARQRAWRIFKRDRPDENPMAWEIRSGALGGKDRPDA